MSSTTNNTYSSSLRTTSYTAPPPPYSPSDTYTVSSTKSTSKSILPKVFQRNSLASPETTSEKSRAEKETKAAARAFYFATM